MTLELDLSLFFEIAVILIWFMIAYQFVLTVYGYLNYIRSLKEKKEIDKLDLDLPTCAILVPAHNEATVIAKTVEAMLRLEYTEGKLEIIIINDGSSDRTREIVESYIPGSNGRLRLFNVPPGEGGKGKSRALNLGVKQTTAEIIAIYDADNTPDPKALRYLVTQLVLHKDLGAVIGKFRTINKNQTLLTRFINVETLSFQSMLQAGRWQMHNIATLPGTNFVMRASIINELNGWDEDALTEDSELSIRIYEHGYKIKFLPYAITYEQEPPYWKVWIKQRVRWVRGNNYVIKKFYKEIPFMKNRRLGFDILYTLLLYYIFFFAIVISDILFVLSLAGLITIPLHGPYTTVWITAFVLFLFEIMLTLSFDDEDTLKNFGIIFLMYFSYCQLWIFLVFRSMYIEHVKKEGTVWDKTVRFDIPDKKDKGAVIADKVAESAVAEP